MSDDDGMLMNFIMDDSTTSSNNTTSKVTGGRWKDRRKLKMMIDGKEPTKRRRADDTISTDDIKKSRSGYTTADATAEMADFNKQPNHDTSIGKFGGTTKITSNQLNAKVVTSLFTSNRQIDTSVNTNKHDDTEKINPSNAPLLADDFESLGVEDVMVKHLNEKMRISKPTGIQKLVLPQLLSNNNKDLFIHAQTGSGKTLAFVLPIISRILQMNVRVDRKSGCFALIIAPTRELASQIYQVLLALSSCCHFLVPCLLIGGERKKSEKARLRKGCNFIIGTPGRILDHFENTKSVKEQLGDSLRYVILDEGDKLMELGFEETLTKILKILHDIPINNQKFPQLPGRIVHLLCSATTKGSVTKLGNVALQNYKLISNGNSANNAELTTIPDQLIQKITIVPPKLRLVTLAATLDNITRSHKKLAGSNPNHISRTMVFLSCSDSVDFHYEVFSSSDSHYRNIVGDSVRSLAKRSEALPSFDDEDLPNVLCYKMHGSLSQQIRTSTLQHFSKNNDDLKGKHLIMFCTDVASRGLDLPNIGTVIEVDPPFAVEDHLHRIGRTARAGQSGEALLFLLPGEEEGYMEHIKPYHTKGWKLLNYTNDILKPAFQNAIVARNDKRSARTTEEWDTNATTWHLNVERRLLDDSTFNSIATKAYMSHIRAYATHISSEKAFFNVKFLHLGHLAKSFGLRERPKSMAAQNSKDQKGQAKSAKENPKNKMFRLAREAQKLSSSEFNY